MMRNLINFFQIAALFCIIATTVVAASNSKRIHNFAVERDSLEEKEGSLQSEDGISAGKGDALDGNGLFSDSASLSALTTPIEESKFEPKRWKAIERMWNRTIHYSGSNENGLTRSMMKRRFRKNLRFNMLTHFSKSVGGMIFEFGDRNLYEAQKCPKRPSLTIAQVRQVARDSFGIPDLQVTYPPCDGAGKTVSCDYDGGTCCMRPQKEFLAKHYDTAVAAMALGATRPEAFAPLYHARNLAYVLESCDPILSHKSQANGNDFLIRVKSRTGDSTRRWNGAGASMISFPLAYEILYEIYNTMLIERIRSRGKLQIPTHAQMQVLHDGLYYRRVMARATYIDVEPNPKTVLPRAREFSAAGLVMASTRRGAKLGQQVVEAHSSLESGPIGVSELPSALRASSGGVISVFEERSNSTKHVDSAKCNRGLATPEYYPYKFGESVWDADQACCALECNFMAQYGSAFSSQGANCCSGCNRLSCAANSFAEAGHLANISSIELSPKANSGPEEFTFII